MMTRQGLWQETFKATDVDNYCTMTAGQLAHLAVRTNANLYIQFGILVPVPLHSEKLVEQVVQAAVNGLSVHQEACFALFNSPANAADHGLLCLLRLVISKRTHLEDFGPLPVQNGLPSLVGAEQQAVC